MCGCDFCQELLKQVAECPCRSPRKKHVPRREYWKQYHEANRDKRRAQMAARDANKKDLGRPAR
jgi:hypothetical protein